MPSTQKSTTRKLLQASQRTSQDYSFLSNLAVGSLFAVNLACAIILAPHIPPAVFLCFVIITSMVAGAAFAPRGAISRKTRASRDPLATDLFHESVDALFLVDGLSGTTVDCNERAITLFDATKKQDIIGIDFNNFLRTRFFPVDVLKEIEEKGAWKREVEYETSTSRRGWSDLAITPVKATDKSLLLARFAEITAYKQAQEQLRQAKEAAEIADQVKSEFLVSMGNEFRVPMEKAFGMSRSILDTSEASDQQKASPKARESIDVLLTIINNMVDFFKIESGKLTLEDVTFDLRTTIDEVIACFPAQTVANVPQLLCLFSYDVPLPLRGDPGRLRQILVNLIGNAFKATTQGEIVVRCALAHATPTHATFRFSVTSADMDISSLIESPSLPSFSLTGLSTLREVDRAGLILAMSKKLVQLMGGEIGAKNDPGEGSTIWFTVTFEKQPPQALLHTSARADLRGLRALIAGKDPELIAPLQQQMHEWGMRSRSTETLQAALQALTTAASTEESYDIVVFVCQALQKEVLDLVRTIRTTVALTTLRLVTLVAVGQRGDARQARQVGLDAYLTTPVPQTQLFECLTTVMSHPPWTARTPHAPLVTRHTLAEEKTRRRPRILVATESTTDQKSAVRLLARLGYRADVVSHGQEIVEALTHVPYAVVLIDHQMSMMDGVEVTFWIRKQDQQEGAHTSILGLVPKGKNDEAGQCFQAGMDDVLFKPLNPEELKAVLDRTLQQSSKSLQPLLTSQSSLPICDQAEALAGVNGDQSLLGEIAGLFLQEYPQFLAAIRKALVQQHAQTLTYAAQTLRSALSNFAAAAATAAALQLENIGRQGDLSQAPAAVAQLEEELSRLHPALASLQQEEIAA